MACPRIFVVNDEAPLRDFFRINLKVRGYDVFDTMGTPDILAEIEKQRPDLVILDLMVSGVDGFELCRQICEASISSVIAINLRGGDTDLIRCLEMGVDDYLGKPFGVDELLARIGAVLRHRRWVRSPEPV